MPGRSSRSKTWRPRGRPVPKSTPQPQAAAQPRRRSNAATLADVAREAGVSQVAVSAVLNGAKTSARTSAETRARVIAAAERLRYQPNATARALVRGRANAVGIVVSGLDLGAETNVYFLEVFVGVIAGATRAGQTTCVFTLRDWDEARQRLPALCDGRVDGMILLAPWLDGAASDWMPASTPFVSVHANRTIAGVANVESDDEAGAFAMVSHMLALGHRRILHVGGPVGAAGADRRIEGYLRAHAAAGVEPPPGHLLRSAFTTEGGRAALQDWLRDHRGAPMPEAVLGGNDAIALGCMETLVARGLRVPADVSVVGFDDSLLARAAGIATVRQPLHEIGSRAVDVLVEHIEALQKKRPWQGPPSIVLPSTVIPRPTLAQPRRDTITIG